MQILNRYTDAVIFEADAKSTKELVWLVVKSEANLRGADLRGANLSDADLSEANLSEANLSDADLSEANLSDADLSDADLSGADLRGADLSDADLSRADLSRADLSDADLRGANLSRADLRGADLSDVRVSNYTTGYFLVCPETGSFTAYKTADGRIITLEILADAKRSSATTRKCRASKAKVIAIDGAEEVCSSYDEDFIYRVGETVEVKDFDDNRWNECSSGIHFFLTRREAELW